LQKGRSRLYLHTTKKLIPNTFMNPDDEAEQAASQILKTTFIMVVFTACHSYQTATTTSVNNIQFSLPDPVFKKSIVPVAIKKKKKTIYLTFDDGPNKGTRNVMHIIAEEQVPVTLFVIGEHVYGSEEQRAAYDSLLQCSYIEIENHSYSHAGNRYAHFYKRPDSVVNDFRRCADSLAFVNKIVRTPGRNIWRSAGINCTDIKKSTAAADSLQKQGFTAIGWDLEWHFDSSLKLIETGDVLLQQADSMFCKGKTKTPGHLVLLAHDQVYADKEDSASLHCFIQKLKAANEYDFEVISKYPGIKN
jgi:peptidoglycan-N-acetylglucosamine deacetylase